MTKKNTEYSILDLAVVSEGVSIQETFKHSLALAQLAEKEGYKRYWLAEHHNSVSIASVATSVLIGFIAGGTKTIRVGSGGIMLPNHSPLIVAEQFGTLGTLYPNRIDLGLGRAPGTDGETARAIRSDFMQLAQMFPGEIEKIERYFSAENKSAKVRATVAEGVDVPLYILGSSPTSAHLAAKKGLPYAFASHFATMHLHDAIKIYRNEFQPSAALEKPYVMAGINVIIADTMEEAERLSTSFIEIIVNLLSGKRELMQAPTEMTPDVRGILNHPAVAQMLKYSFVGTKETVKKQVQSFLEETGVDELIVVTGLFDDDARLKSYEDFAEVMRETNN